MNLNWLGGITDFPILDGMITAGSLCGALILLFVLIVVNP